MNKSELIAALAEKQNLTNQTGASIVNVILNSIAETLIRGDHVEIRGFGRFSVKEYGSYTGRNPQTGESVIVKSKKSPVFRVGKELREAVNSSRINMAS